jgi:hypothetical protein
MIIQMLIYLKLMQIAINKDFFKKLKYTFEDKETGHSSTSDYRMIVVKKIETLI